MDIGGVCMIGGKFLKEWQVTDKVTESIFSNLLSTIYKWPKLKK